MNDLSATYEVSEKNEIPPKNYSKFKTLLLIIFLEFFKTVKIFMKNT